LDASPQSALLLLLLVLLLLLPLLLPPDQKSGCSDSMRIRSFLRLPQLCARALKGGLAKRAVFCAPKFFSRTFF